MSEQKIRIDNGVKGNVYERIVVAAREARRINAVRLRGGMVDTDSKVTNEALRRTADGDVNWEIDDVRAGGRNEKPKPSGVTPDEESPVDDSR